jgi:anhydro-N-acetylmuramic acid kinase
MIKSDYKVIGVMSGTSLDGIDIISASLNFDGKWHYKIHCTETIKYPKNWFEILKKLTTYSLDEIQNIDKDYTYYLSTVINDFIDKNNITDIDAVCSHGHTALHQPEKGLTYQIGNLPILASLINQTVICDFRVQDVELGGQGAPLVPIGDQLLFPQYIYCLNLGGFANLSTETDNNRIAYDICPVNIVMNHYASQLGLDYDAEGKIAATGNINEESLNALNTIPYYKQSYPKSLGFEWVRNVIIPSIDSFELSDRDVLRTFAEHIGFQISKALNSKEHGTVFVTGGGVFNLFLIRTIQNYTKNKIVIPSNEIIEFKEALIFGFLGVLRLRNEVNCLQSVTGAQKDHSSGKIFHP